MPLDPILETEDDRTKEHRVGEYVASLFDWTCQHLPRRNGLDFLWRCDGQVMAMGELKVRTSPFGAYPDYLMAVSKYQRLLTAKRVSPRIYGVAPIEALFLVRFSDGVLALIEVDDIDPSKTDTITRTQPRASGLVGSHDREPGIHVPYDRFSIIGDLR